MIQLIHKHTHITPHITNNNAHTHRPSSISNSTQPTPSRSTSNPVTSPNQQPSKSPPKSATKSRTSPARSDRPTVTFAGANQVLNPSTSHVNTSQPATQAYAIPSQPATQAYAIPSQPATQAYAIPSQPATQAYAIPSQPGTASMMQPAVQQEPPAQMPSTSTPQRAYTDPAPAQHAAMQVMSPSLGRMETPSAHHPSPSLTHAVAQASPSSSWVDAQMAGHIPQPSLAGQATPSSFGATAPTIPTPSAQQPLYTAGQTDNRPITPARVGATISSADTDRFVSRARPGAQSPIPGWAGSGTGPLARMNLTEQMQRAGVFFFVFLGVVCFCDVCVCVCVCVTEGVYVF
jgi:hypothetical protein